MNVRHVGVTVTNMEESMKFYQELFGFDVTRVMDESGLHIDKFSGLDGVQVQTVKMTAPNGGMIELLEYSSHPRESSFEDITHIGCSHFALTVDNLPNLYQRLLEYGSEVLCEPQYSPDGMVRLTFCKDPDGTLIELVEEL